MNGFKMLFFAIIPNPENDSESAPLQARHVLPSTRSQFSCVILRSAASS